MFCLQCFLEFTKNEHAKGRPPISIKGIIGFLEVGDLNLQFIDLCLRFFIFIYIDPCLTTESFFFAKEFDTIHIFQLEVSGVSNSG